MNQVICMNWGTAYGADYVNRLWSMVRRNLRPPHRFVCYTDNTTGIRPEVECCPCPELPVRFAKQNRGWRKLTLWSTELEGVQGQALFLDLDVVITGSLDCFFEFAPEADFCVIRNWTHPGRRIGNTSAYRFRVGSHPEVLSRFVDDYETVLATCPNSQTWISRCLDADMMFWPLDWCCSFKRHCVPKGPWRWIRRPGLPPGARIVAFPGRPNPHEAAAGFWPAPWYKRPYKHIRAAKWLQECWQ